ncbi:MAG: hypothetical protein IJT44_11605 [Clostridia bacterium]|nr:hypothetical protein [Clostridia bacterium]
MKTHNRHVKSLLAFALALCMIFGACPLSSFVGLVSAAEERQGNPLEGLGKYWNYYNDGEIQFTDDIKALTDADKTPWVVTDKNGHSMNVADSVVTITILNTVKKIGANAFKGLKPAVLGIPKTVTSIDAAAFTGSQIKEIYYGGTRAQWNAMITTPAGIRVNFGHVCGGEVPKHQAEATCSQPGYEGDLYCSLCGAFYKVGKTTDKVDHVWSDDYAIVPGKEPTCSKDGYQAKFCIYCGTYNYDSMVVVPATGEHKWVVLDADKVDLCDEHIGKHIVMHCAYDGCSVASTDAQFQQLTYKYKESADSDVIVDSKQSNFSLLTEVQQQNVVNAEEVEYNQWLYNYTIILEDNKNPKKAVHHYVYTADKAPTCTEPGNTLVTCAWCTGYTDNFPIDPTGHNNVVEYVIPADCVNPGERGTRCTDCGNVLSYEVIPNNHTPGYYSGTWVTQKLPNCVEDGYQWLKCNYCGEWIYDENGDKVQKRLPSTPDVHTASRWFTTLKPTCTEKGEQIKICTVRGCPYFSDTDIGKKVVKISERKALDHLIAVTKDLNKDHYHYAPYEVKQSADAAVEPGFDPDSEKNVISPVNADERVYDVADELNMAILAAFQNGTFDKDGNLIEEDRTKLAAELTKIFVTAVDHHGFSGLDKDGLETFFYDKFNYKTESDFLYGYNCVGEAKSEARFVFDEIVEEAVKLLIAKDSVINTTDDVVAILTEAWENLGDSEIADVIANHKDQIAKVTNKALAKEEIPADGHDWVRCYDIDEDKDGVVTFGYIVINNEFVPVCKKAKERATGDSATNTDEWEDGWYRVDHYDGHTPVAGDEYVGDKAVTSVNCIEGDGNMIYQCAVCMKLKEPTLVKQGSHTLKTKTFPATCYENGYDRTYCTKCDYYVDVQTDIKLTHNYQETTIKESTCSKAGIKVKICEYCGDVAKKTYQTLALRPHKDSPVHEDATCMENGRDGMICSVCGRFDGEILEALGHDYVETVVLATCTEPGYTSATCSRCGDTKAPYDYVAVAGHQYGRPINVPATCEEGSYTYEQCKNCPYRKVYNQQSNQLGHIMTTLPARQPSCTEPGCTEKIYCKRDGCTYVQKEAESIPALGHLMQTNERKPATCTEDGYETYVACARCGYGEETKVVIPATGHTFVEKDGVEPTCTDPGYSDYTQCKDCGAYGVPKTPIPASGHNFGDWTTTDEARPFHSGTKTRVCKECGAKETKSYKLTFGQAVWWIITWLPRQIANLFRYFLNR